MKRKKIIWFIMVMLGLVLIPTRSVRADMFPKPSMDFTFIYETEDDLEITDGDLMECENADCSQATPKGEFQSWDFKCEENQCRSVDSEFSTHSYLVITFSDGKTRESNLFEKKHYSAYYKVTVREDGLIVREVGGTHPASVYIG